MTILRASFHLIGLCVRTSNQNGQAHQDLAALWQSFLQNNTQAQIPHKIDDTLFCVYTDYEGDYTQPYTAYLGCRVLSLESVPEGLVGKTIAGGEFQHFSAKGDIMHGAVAQTWGEIWASPLKRAYTADYEVYGEKAQDLTNAEVDIWVAVA